MLFRITSLGLIRLEKHKDQSTTEQIPTIEHSLMDYKFICCRLIFSKNTRWKKSWFDYFLKYHPVAIITNDIIKFEHCLERKFRIFICKTNSRIWSKAEVKTPEVFNYMIWGLFVSWKYKDCLSKRSTLTFFNRDIVWLVFWKR